MKFQKYITMALVILALCLSVLVYSNGTMAAQKSRTDLQTDLDNAKLNEYNAELFNDVLTTANDSAFNLTTDDLDDISDGSTSKLIPAADATLLGSIESSGVTSAEIDKVADDSDRIVSVSGVTALTCATNGTGFINFISSGSGIFTGTLPAATATGCVYNFV